MRRSRGRANLKTTSLYDLAVKIGIEDPSVFVQNFIDYERGHTADESKII